jgi:hypothetical protein
VAVADREAPPVLESIAVVAAGGWFALYLGCAAATSDGGWGGGWVLRRRLRRFRPDGGPPALAEPALVNLVTTGCQLDGAAFAATILQLGSRGALAISEPQPGRLWCEPAAQPAGGADVAPFERLVLDQVSRQFAEADGAPFQALCDMCFADVKGVWDPFEEAVRAEGRRRGLTRPRLPKAALALLYAGAVPVAALAGAAVRGTPRGGGWAGAIITSLFSLVFLAVLTGALGRRDRLAPAGAALAAWAMRAAVQSPSLLSDPGHLALAAATDGGPPVPALGHIRRGDVRQGGHRGSMTSAATPERLARAPRQAWSSRDGQWRLVPVGPRRESPRLVAAGLLVGSAVTGLAALGSYAGYHTLQMSKGWLLVPATLLAASAALAVAGVRAVARWLALPAEVSFDGQVIARWIEESSDGSENSNTVTYWCLALDDGERSWTFDVGQAAFADFALGARVLARVAPRSMRLLDLALAGPEGELRPGLARWGAATGMGPAPWAARPGLRLGWAPATDGPAPDPLLAGPLVTPLNAGAVLGFGVAARGTPTTFASAYQGNGVTVSLVTTSGRVGEVNARAARRSGQPLPGIGEGAWLVNRGRTAVVQAGGKTVKVTVRGRPGRIPPDAVTKLAAIVAERLAERSELR